MGKRGKLRKAYAIILGKFVYKRRYSQHVYFFKTYLFSLKGRAVVECHQKIVENNFGDMSDEALAYSQPWSDWMMLLAAHLLMNRICRSTEINKIKSREAHLEPICLHKQKYQFESGKRYLKISSWSCWVFLYSTIV